MALLQTLTDSVQEAMGAPDFASALAQGKTATVATLLQAALEKFG
jgi:hypothetical protein